jgi:hypothetical protein
MGSVDPYLEDGLRMPILVALRVCITDQFFFLANQTLLSMLQSTLMKRISRARMLSFP